MNKKDKYDFDTEQEYKKFLDDYRTKTNWIDDIKLLQDKLNHYRKINSISMDRIEKIVTLEITYIIWHKLAELLSNKENGWEKS